MYIKLEKNNELTHGHSLKRYTHPSHSSEQSKPKCYQDSRIYYKCDQRSNTFFIAIICRE